MPRVGLALRRCGAQYAFERNTRHRDRGSVIRGESKTIDNLACQRLLRVGGSGEHTARRTMHTKSTQMSDVDLGSNRERHQQPPDVVDDARVIESHTTLDGVAENVCEQIFVANTFRRPPCEGDVVSGRPSENVGGRHVEKMGTEQSIVEVDAQRPVPTSEGGPPKRVARGPKAQATKRFHGRGKPLTLDQQVDVREVSMAAELRPPAEEHHPFERRRGDTAVPERFESLTREPECQIRSEPPCSHLRGGWTRGVLGKHLPRGTLVQR